MCGSTIPTRGGASAQTGPQVDEIGPAQFIGGFRTRQELNDLRRVDITPGGVRFDIGRDPVSGELFYRPAPVSAQLTQDARSAVTLALLLGGASASDEDGGFVHLAGGEAHDSDLAAAYNNAG